MSNSLTLFGVVIHSSPCVGCHAVVRRAERLDRDVAEAVLLREVGDDAALAIRAVVFLGQAHALIGHQLEHVVHRALARDLVDDRGHLRLREQRAILAFLRARGERGRGRRARRARNG